MTIIDFRSMSLAAVALIAVATPSTVQDKAPTLLNTVEVRQLVARSEPSDHARLSAHFTALGGRYSAEAKRHSSMAQSFIGNPSRNLTTGMAAHCQRLADLNRESAATVLELAAFHQKMASGTVTAPVNSPAFEAGAGAAPPSDQELSALAAKANSPADHRILEQYFLTLAKRYAADAADHKAMASVYRGLPRSPGAAAAAAAHCDRLATASREAAREAGAAAATHGKLAGAGR